MGRATGAAAVIAHCCIGKFVVINKFRPHRLSLTHFSKVGSTLTLSAGAVQLPQDSKAQRPCRIDLHSPAVLIPNPPPPPLQMPWAHLLIAPSPGLINACLLQQVKPFIRNRRGGGGGGVYILSQKKKKTGKV